MSGGGALFGLLRRPATAAWIPLSGLASLTAVFAGALIWEFVLDAPFRMSMWADAVVLVFPAMIGLLVGQAIKELQHCHFSWGLPDLRHRLLPGAVVVGLVLAFGTREILTGLTTPLLFVLEPHPADDVRDLWLAFPSLSPSTVAISFMVFWIGVRPSFTSWLGVMAPIALFSAPLLYLATELPVLGVAVTTPIAAYLIYRTFGVESARRQPFIPTQPLSGVGGRADQRRRPWTIGRSRGAVWRIELLGDNVAYWVRAGAYENHGFHSRFVRAAGLAIPTLAAAYIVGHLIVPLFDGTGASSWSFTGVASVAAGRVMSAAWTLFNLSIVTAVPLSVVLACYASISLTRKSPYPLSRRQMARVEFWGSLTENVIICGFIAALLIGYWSYAFGGLGFAGSVTWPASSGGDHGWIPFLLRPLSVVFLLMPVTQLFRLRIRGPIGWSSVRLLVSVVALMFALTVLAVLAGSRAFALIPTLSMLVDGPLFLAVAVLFQMAYWHLVDRYFATADLV